VRTASHPSAPPLTHSGDESPRSKIARETRTIHQEPKKTGFGTGNNHLRFSNNKIACVKIASGRRNNQIGKGRIDLGNSNNEMGSANNKMGSVNNESGRK